MLSGDTPGLKVRSAPTGSEALDFVATQVWGEAIDAGEVQVTLADSLPPGWEPRERYWVVTGLKAPRLLIPTSRRAAARSLADYARLRSPRTRAVRRALAAVAGSGAPLSRHVLTVAARIGAPATTVPQIGETVGHPDAVAALGVRTGANAKPTLELRTSDGSAIGFVKLSWNALTAAAIDNEANAMKQFRATSSAAIRAPRVLDDGLLGDRRFLMTEALPRSIADVPANWDSLDPRETIGPGAVRSWQPLGGTQVDLVHARLTEAGGVTPRALIDRARDLARRLSSSGIVMPRADFWHGDFTPWNIGRDLTGQLWLFDWETAEPEAPAGLDAMHWLTHANGDTEPDTLVRRVDEAARRAHDILRALGHDATGAAMLPCWYAVTLVTNEIRFAESLRGWERVKYPVDALDRVLQWGQLKFSSQAGGSRR